MKKNQEEIIVGVGIILVIILFVAISFTKKDSILIAGSHPEILAGTIVDHTIGLKLVVPSFDKNGVKIPTIEGFKEIGKNENINKYIEVSVTVDGATLEMTGQEFIARLGFCFDENNFAVKCK